MTFIGVGAMSGPMIENALKAGYRARLYNRTRSRAEAFAGNGVEIFERPEDAVLPGGLVLSCLAADAALEDVFGDGRVFERMGAGSLHVSTSTCRPETQRRLHDALTRAGGMHVSAPLLGRPDLVAARKQSFLWSGSPRGKELAEPVLARLSAKRFDFGAEPETAAVVKICTNYLIASAIQSMAEAMAAAEKRGVDLSAMHEMWTNTIFGSVVHRGYGASILARQYTKPLFRLDLGLKDVRLAKELGESSSAPLLGATLLEEQLALALERGLAGFDWTGLADLSFERAGLPTAEKPTER